MMRRDHPELGGEPKQTNGVSELGGKQLPQELEAKGGQELEAQERQELRGVEHSQELATG